MLMAVLMLPLVSVAQRYTFHNLNVDDGLVQSQPTCLTQDRAGNLWVGTLGGLSRYDGRSFTNYTVSNGLLNNTIRAIAPDSAGNMWIGTPSGLSKFDGKNFTNYTPRGSATNSFQQIEIVNDTVWWRVAGEVYFVAKGKLHTFPTPGAAGTVSAMLKEKDQMWLAKDGVLYHSKPKGWDNFSFGLSPEQGTLTVYCIYRDVTGVVWVTTNFGLYKVGKDQLIPLTINGAASSFLPAITSITQDRSGALWLGTNSGVMKISATVMQVYNKRNGLSDNAFFDMLTDAEGNVWMASDGQGVFRFSGTQFTGLDETMGLGSGQVMSIAASKKDSLVIGTYDAGLFSYKDGLINPIAFPSNPNLPVPGITALCYTKRGNLWIGTRGRGLWSYDKEVFRQYVSPERNFPSNYINCLYEDKSGRLWIGFANGAVMFDDDSFKTIISRNINVRSFLDIGNNRVLIATEDGIRLNENDTTIRYKTNTMVDSSSINCFITLGKYLWMGSSDNGVIRYDMEAGKAIVINKLKGLRSDFIYNIIADNDSNIWVGTGFGIHKIRMNGDVPEITFYGKEQGVIGMESNINAVLKLPDGSIWFGTTKGAYHYQPHAPLASSKATSIVLQSVKLPGEEMKPEYYDGLDTWFGIPHRLRLPPNKSSIAFQYQAISLSGSQQMQYRYRMEGLETPWSDWSSTNSVTFSALPSGNYVFRVQCRGAEGQYVKELKYPFEVITPLTRTAWFRIMVLTGCIILGILLQYFVSHRRQRRRRLVVRLRGEEQAKIRLRTAEDFHDEIGNKLTRINVLTSVLKNKIQQTPDTQRILGQIEENTSQLYSGTRDILWSLKPSNDNLYEILSRIRDFGNELFQDTEIHFAFEGIDESWRKYRLTMDVSRNLLMIFKEALNNALKYSEAKNVWIEVLMKRRNVMQLIIRDDGKGFDLQLYKKGNGINNMTIRAGRIEGRLYVDSRPGKGTIINLTFKIPQNR